MRLVALVALSAAALSLSAPATYATPLGVRRVLSPANEIPPTASSGPVSRRFFSIQPLIRSDQRDVQRLDHARCGRAHSLLLALSALSHEHRSRHHGPCVSWIPSRSNVRDVKLRAAQSDRLRDLQSSVRHRTRRDRERRNGASGGFRESGNLSEHPHGDVRQWGDSRIPRGA